MDEYGSSPKAEVATAIAGVLTIGGVLTFALFPLVLPILLLTGVFAAPLLLPVLLIAVVGVPIAGLAAAVRGLRNQRLRRLRIAADGRRRGAERGAADSRSRAAQHTLRHRHAP